MTLQPYKSYYAIVDYSAEDNVYFGKIGWIKDLISFEGETLADLQTAFEEAVDDYIQTLKDISN